MKMNQMPWVAGWAISAKSARQIAIAIVVLAFGFQAWLACRVLGGHPFCGDEYNYWYQAQMFARGQTHVEVSDPLPGITERYVLVKDGKLFSKYIPGYPLVLALGTLLKVPALVNPLISAASLLMFFFLAVRIVGHAWALLALLWIATSSYFAGYGASFFSQPLSLCLSLAAIFFALRNDERPSRTNLLILGLSIGFLAWVRQLDAFCAAIAVFSFHLCSRGWRRAFRWALGWGAVSSLFLIGILAYNFWLSGRLALSSYPVLNGEFQLAADESAGILTNLLNAGEAYLSQFLPKYLVPLLFEHFLPYAGWAVPVLALLQILTPKQSGRYKALLGGHVLALVLLYNFHRVKGDLPGWPQYGARYWYPGFPAIVLLAALSLKNVIRLINERLRRDTEKMGQMVGAAVAIAIVGLQLHTHIERIDDYRFRYQVVTEVKRDLEAQCPGRRIVFLPQSGLIAPYVFLQDILHRNPFREGERLFVRGRENLSEVLRAYPDRALCTYRMSNQVREFASVDKLSHL